MTTRNRFSFETHGEKTGEMKGIPVSPMLMFKTASWKCGPFVLFLMFDEMKQQNEQGLVRRNERAGFFCGSVHTRGLLPLPPPSDAHTRNGRKQNRRGKNERDQDKGVA